MRDSKRDTDVQNSLLDSVGEGKGAMIWENDIETCILLYMKWIASLGSMHETGCSGQVVGGGFTMGSTRIPVAGSWQCMAKPLQYCKVISFRLK